MVNAMQPSEFLRTLYLGDRACKSLLIDGWNERVALQVEPTISRIRSPSGRWEYYTDEDIDNGLVVFTGVESIVFEPPGLIPNDAINSIDVEPIGKPETSDAGQRFLFKLCIASGLASGEYAQVSVKVVAKGVHLEDPARPGLTIKE
jgi:hypothetical protein